MRARRAPGELQDLLLGHLWDAGRPMTTTELRTALAAGGLHLAATTVYTVVARLVAKGKVERLGGRGAVRPMREQSTSLALSMASTLRRGHDRHAVLRAFVRRLSPHERGLLREALDRRDASQKNATEIEGGAHAR